MSWWGETHEEWYEPEGGKGWRRGASRPAWEPAQNADFGWMPDIPGMPSKQEVLNANPWKKNGCPKVRGIPKWGNKRIGEMHWLRRLRHRRLCLSLCRAQGPAQAMRSQRPVL